MDKASIYKVSPTAMTFRAYFQDSGYSGAAKSAVGIWFQEPFHSREVTVDSAPRLERDSSKIEGAAGVTSTPAGILILRVKPPTLGDP